MSKTRQDLIARALLQHGVPGPGGTASAEDVQYVDDAIDPMFDSLAQREIFQWGDPDQIDDSAFLHLVAWLANATGRPFGVTPDPSIALLEEQNLRVLKPVYLSGQPQQTEYF